MRIITTILIFVIFSIKLIGQTISVSDKLTLIKLTDRTYIHTCQNNNGLVFINAGKALIVSTPASDEETQNLIDWVEKEQGAKIKAYVIDRWHPDAMGGIDIVHKNGIKTYAYELTQEIAKKKGLAVPQTGFNPKTEIQIGDEAVICHFLGEAHTRDGIVVWIPSEQILFGGNEIRNFKGWVGNIGDANLDKWSETATHIKREYGHAKIVIPGHRKHGGSELIDYTINLYKFSKNQSAIERSEILIRPNLKTDNEFTIKAESDSLQNEKRILKNAILIAQDETKYIEIESPQILYRADKKRIDSEIGRLRIYDKTVDNVSLRTDVNYKKLIVYKHDDSVGFVVILKAIESSNR